MAVCSTTPITFTGDDDVRVYFDKQLGIDLGGVHGAETATVDLDTLLAGHAAGNCSFDLFYAERHTTESDLTISTSLALAPNASTVPEPSTCALALWGVLSAGGVARRKRSA